MSGFSVEYVKTCRTVDGVTTCVEELSDTRIPRQGAGNKVPAVDDPTKIPAGAANSQNTALVERFSTTEAVIRNTTAATNNWLPPQPQKIPGKNAFAYLTAPARLKRLFGSPLTLEGKYAYGTGDTATREVSAGWGAADYTGIVHTGLDFPATYGEDVYACGSGRVAFVGYIRASDSQPVPLPGAYQDPEGNVHGKDTDAVIPRSEIGDGGIAIRVEHNGDFSGYHTEYYHLSEVAVKIGDRVTEEQAAIGFVGTSGNAESPHLHLTVSYYKGGRATVVNPSALVPNYYPGHPDTTQIAGDILWANFINPGPGGQTLVAGNAATSLGTIDRSTGLQNATRESVTSAQTAHLEHIAQTTGQQRRQLLEAAAKYQQAGLVVIDAMTYNFETGMWCLGDIPDAPV